MRDVTYFLGWSLEVDDRSRLERELIARYLDGLARRGVAEVPTSNEAFELHRLFMVDAWNSAWGPLAMYDDVDELVPLLIGRFSAALSDLETERALRAAL